MGCCLTGGTAPTEVHQAEQTRRVNDAAMCWPMHASRAPTRSQRESRFIAALPAIAITFAMHAMIGRHSAHLKMPRRDA